MTRPIDAGPDGKMFVGAILRDDWTLPRGYVREVVAIMRAEAELDTPPGAYRGSSLERCAMFGGSAKWTDEATT